LKTSQPDLKQSQSSGIANKAHVIAVLGVTGSGKSTWVKRTFLNPPPDRLLIWDYSPLDEYATFAQRLPLREMVEAAYRCHRRGLTFQFLFKPRVGQRPVLEHQFAVFCNLALALGNLTMIVEELRYVTMPSRAPDAWARAVLMGRKAGLTVVGTSQRPAHIDKDFAGNATVIHTGRLVYPEDIIAVSRAMICPPERIQRLDFLEWLEADERRNLTSGRLAFSGRDSPSHATPRTPATPEHDESEAESTPAAIPPLRQPPQ
jgi:hypothetical protein